MTFDKDFLRELQKRLNSSSSGSSLYPMTKYSVDGLLKFKQLVESDKKVILDAIRNDVCRKGDPLLVKQFWNENIEDSKL